MWAMIEKLRSRLCGMVTRRQSSRAWPGPSGSCNARGVTATTDLRLYALDGGRVHATGSDAAEFTDDGAYDGRSFDLPVPWFLIRHPDGDLVWDSGMSRTRTDLGAWATAGPNPVDQLAAHRLVPEDIRFLSLSHGHWDHSGNAGMFARSTWIANPAERDVMFDDESRASAAMYDYGALERADVRTITDDHDVFGDGSVLILQAPGHTIGHTVLLVRLAEAGPVLLSGDLWHLVESRIHRRVPTFNIDRAETLASMDKVEALVASARARVIVQHDPTDYAALQQLAGGLR
jgi:N-acyl homoserine lactone hydrolase